ncbi:hypothetical protein [Streptomyces sp. TLI_171]|uniref:hypothetical protein n=1 Tax=Streptomyces sp. TLI_171 TaxID=1938859 RepID=UPI00117F140F|nr:hypothetical protein [Streptomyces sp. TLI_171]
MTITEERATALLRGVAANPRAGTEVLTRLLAPAAADAREVLQRRPLPAEFVQRTLRTGDRRERSAVARNLHLTADQCRQVIRDPEDLVAAALVSARPFRQGTARAVQLPDDVVDLVLLGTAQRETMMLLPKEIAEELVTSGHLVGHRRRLVDHPEPALRAFACTYWTELGEDQRAALLADPDPEVRAKAHRNAHPDLAELGTQYTENSPRNQVTHCWASALPDELLDTLITERTHLAGLVRNPYLPPHAVRRLAADPDPAVRRRIAERPDVEADLLAVLAADPDEGVRRCAELLPAPRTRGRAAAVFGLFGASVADLPWPMAEPVDDPGLDWYHACAASPEAVLRRAAAISPRLDAATVQRLAADPDREVRLRLALHHPDAPPTLLLEAYAQLPAHRSRLRLRPAFPRTGLPPGLATDADPAVRELAAADPEFGGDLETLLADPDPGVRRAAAANPRLPADRVAALLTGPEADSETDPETGPDADLGLLEGAAASPHLTDRRLHELLDLAGIPRSGPAG